MCRIVALCGAGLLLLTASAALAETPATGISGSVQAPAPPTALVAPGGPREHHPVFWIGSLPVTIWAPVAPPYDTTADRNGAANPLWGPP